MCILDLISRFSPFVLHCLGRVCLWGFVCISALVRSGPSGEEVLVFSQCSSLFKGVHWCWGQGSFSLSPTFTNPSWSSWTSTCSVSCWNKFGAELAQLWMYLLPKWPDKQSNSYKSLIIYVMHLILMGCNFHCCNYIYIFTTPVKKLLNTDTIQITTKKA